MNLIKKSRSTQLSCILTCFRLVFRAGVELEWSLQTVACWCTSQLQFSPVPVCTAMQSSHQQCATFVLQACCLFNVVDANSFFKITFVCLFCVLCIHVPLRTCRRQRTARRSWFCSSVTFLSDADLQVWCRCFYLLSRWAGSIIVIF